MRRAPLLAALAVMALLAAAPGAVAATFCVAKPSCAGTPEPDLPHALNDAAASHADFRDRIELGAGTFSYPGQATDGPGNDVDIVGAGRGLTTLSATGTVLSMSDASSTLSDLRISASGAPARLLDVTAGTVKRVDIDATGTDAGASTVGVRLRGRGAVLDDASIVMA